MRTRLRPLPLAVGSAVVLALGIGAWSPASQAGTTPAACTSVGPNLTDFSAVLTLPKFDPTLGTLTGVTISGSDKVTMRIRVENEGPVAYQMGGDLSAIGTLTLPGGETAKTSSAYSHKEMLPAYDGTTDWAGSGFDTGPIEDQNTVTPIEIVGPGVANYVGPGTFDSIYVADGSSTFDGPGVATYWFESTAAATVCVSYSYTEATTTTMPATSSTTTSSSTTTVPASTSSTTSTTTPRSTTTSTTTPRSTTTSTTSTTAPCATSTTSTTPATTTPSTTPLSTTPLSTTTVPWVTTTTMPGCGPTSTTTTTSTTAPRTTTSTAPARPTSTTGVPAATSTTVPTSGVVTPTVAVTTGATVPSVSVATPATSRLPRTGSEPLPTLLIGAGLLGSGASLVSWRRSLRHAEQRRS